MPIFQYRAIDTGGQPATGTIDADSPKDARQKLRARRLMVTDIAAESAAPEVGGLKIQLPQFFSRKRLTELSVVTRQLATLLNAGIPLAQALAAMIEQAENRTLLGILQDVRERVTGGTSFADALANHPRTFSDLYVNMVRAGEAAGNLDVVLAKLADYVHAQARLRAKIAAALTYPMILLSVGFAVVFFLIAFVVPKIVNVLKQQHKTKLPLPTEILILVSNFVKDYWWLMGLALVGLYALFQFLVSNEQGRFVYDRLKLRLPVIGPFLRKAAVSRFASTFATLLESGIPVMEALLIVRRVVNNMLLARTIDEVREKIMAGADISTPIKKSGVFPPVLSYMIAIGEESGRLEQMLRKVADAYDEEIDIATQKLTALMEPVMIVFMAVVVGFIVLSILLPILEMSKIG